MATTDESAARFRALALPLLAYLDRLAVALTGDRQAAEDLAQDTMLRGLRYFETFSGEDFRAWMAAIMRNLYRTRRTGPTIAVDDVAVQKIVDTALDPEQEVLARETDARLRALIRELPEQLREALVLREYGELSYTQIASTLDVPIGTVMSRLSRARDALRAGWRAVEIGAGR